jgi:hypothetical protein
MSRKFKELVDAMPEEVKDQSKAAQAKLELA